MLELDIALLILRIVIGLLFIGHGAQKLFGWFGGHGITGTANWLESLGLSPPKFWAIVSGSAEFFGGFGLVLGLFTPVAAALIIGVMLMAIIKIHWVNGLWITQNGMEYALLNAVVVALIGLVEPGRYALDSFLNIAYPMPMTFWIALAVVVIGVLIAVFSSRRMSQPEAQRA